MYGLVNKALQDLLIREHGAATWDAVRTRAGHPGIAFVGMQPYPDAVTYDLVAAASAELGRPAPALLEDFGRHWTRYTAREGYGEMLRMMGSTVPEFLGNLQHLHDRLRVAMPRMQPPRMVCSDIGPDSLRLRYYSQRPGLAPFVIGLVAGIGDLLGLRVEARQIGGRGEGSDHDEFLVSWRPRA